MANNNQNNQSNHNNQSYQGSSRRKDDALLQVVAEKVSNLHEDMSDVKTTLKDSMKGMTEAFNKLIQLEERQANILENVTRVAKSSEKAHARIDQILIDSQAKYEKIEARIDSLEKDAPMQKQASTWVMNAIYAIAAASVGYIAKMLGIL